MLKFKYIFLVLFILQATLVAKTVSFHDFIKTTVAHHPQTQVSYHEFLSSLNKNMANNAIQDWNIFINYSKTYGSSLFGNYSSATKMNVLEAGTEHVFTDYGTRLSLSSSFTSTVNQPSFGSIAMPDNYATTLKVQVMQPLLKNAHGIIDRYPLRLKDNLDELAQSVYDDQLQDFIADISTTYIQWYFTYQMVEIIQKQVEKSAKQVAISQRQFESNVIEELDVILAKQNLNQNKKNLIKSQRDLAYMKQKVIFLMTGNVNSQQTEIAPEKFNFNTRPNVTQALAYIDSQSSFVSLLDLNQILAKDYYYLTIEETKPALDMYITQSFASSEDNQGDALSNIGSNNPTSVGLVYQKSLSNTAKISEQAAAKEDLKKIIASNEAALFNVKEMIAQMYNNLTSIEEQMVVLEQTSKLNQQVTQLELTKFKQGRSSTLSFYLTAENRELLTQLEKNQLNMSYYLIENQLQRMLDYYQQFIEEK
ncbi:hypothetical protein DID76_01395 [Candidatus Marinamargulisbacteria bacterium SCGC AG-414-C22]|nr:hypothetical protein DID76_01395 [Candidatus Marinamargulisbacteria bacterium SCGC AG-414-C22]